MIFTATSWADDFVPEGEDDMDTSANIFTLDADNTGGDIKLQFGKSLAENFGWDGANARFLLSDSLDLLGNELINYRMENLASAPTCDASGVGRIYYNTIDKLTYSCDGVSVWNPLENALNATIEFPVVQARRTTSYALTTTYADVTLDTTDLENDITTLDHDNTNRDRIDIGATAMYQIIYGYTAGGSATATHEARARVRVNDITVLPGSESVNTNYQNEFSTTSASFLANLTDGDFISLQLQRSATVDVTQDEIYFSIIKLEGIKGEKGDAGTDGTNGVDGTNGIDGDIVWRGIWVSQNYILHDTVEYLGSTYTCKLNTVSSEIPTNTTYWDLVAAKGDTGPQGLPGTAGNGTDSETFTIDVDDTGGNLSLVFGTTLNKTLTWDSTNLRFNLDDTLRVTGNLEQDGTNLALDTDNIGVGVNVDIVANQGSDSDGTLRYNATDNQWEFSNDGGSFNPMHVPQVFEAYDNAGGIALSTIQTVLALDSTRVSDGIYNLLGNSVTINKDGLYHITGKLGVETLDTAGTQRGGIEMWFQADTGSGFVNVPGTFCKEYVREQNLGLGGAACSADWFGALTVGDRIQLTHRKNGTTNSQTLASSSGLTIEFIR